MEDDECSKKTKWCSEMTNVDDQRDEMKQHIITQIDFYQKLHKMQLYLHKYWLNGNNCVTDMFKPTENCGWHLEETKREKSSVARRWEKIVRRQRKKKQDDRNNAYNQISIKKPRAK